MRTLKCRWFWISRCFVVFFFWYCDLLTVPNIPFLDRWLNGTTQFSICEKGYGLFRYAIDYHNNKFSKFRVVLNLLPQRSCINIAMKSFLHSNQFFFKENSYDDMVWVFKFEVDPTDSRIYITHNWAGIFLPLISPLFKGTHNVDRSGILVWLQIEKFRLRPLVLRLTFLPTSTSQKMSKFNYIGVCSLFIINCISVLGVLAGKINP